MMKRYGSGPALEKKQISRNRTLIHNQSINNNSSTTIEYEEPVIVYQTPVPNKSNSKFRLIPIVGSHEKEAF